MNKEQFIQTYLNKVIHCPTHKEAINYFKLLREFGYKWRSGREITTDTKWFIHENETCYKLTENQGLSYGYVDQYNDIGYKIYDSLGKELGNE